MTDEDVARDLLFYHEAHRYSWRRLGEIIGKSGAYAMRLTWEISPFGSRRARAIKLTPAVRDKWLEWRGKVKIHTTYGCPSCGELHNAGDCGGRRGGAVFVASDEKVIKRRRRPMSARIADLPAWELGRRIREREEMP